MKTNKIRVTVWNEFRHEKTNLTVKGIYPGGMHETIAERLCIESDFAVHTATLDEPEHGLTKDVLDKTDVLIWWGHVAHEEVKNETVDMVQSRILAGMGLVVLHSGHHSKIFRRMMGTSCLLRWREAHEKEKLWVVDPTHPIAKGLPPFIELPHEEMYGEHFDIPTPDDLVFVSWFEGGEVFRSGCCFNRGLGRIFYFRPGHEAYPSFHNADVMNVIVNAVRWTFFQGNDTVKPFYGKMTDPLEKILSKHCVAEPIRHPSLEK